MNAQFWKKFSLQEQLSYDELINGIYSSRYRSEKTPTSQHGKSIYLEIGEGDSGAAVINFFLFYTPVFHSYARSPNTHSSKPFTSNLKVRGMNSSPAKTRVLKIFFSPESEKVG